MQRSCGVAKVVRTRKRSVRNLLGRGFANIMKRALASVVFCDVHLLLSGFLVIG